MAFGVFDNSVSPAPFPPGDLGRSGTEMNALILVPLMIGQIDAGPSPEAIAKHLRINAFGIRSGMAESPGVDHFPIARYLRLAELLQSMTERERVTWLRMAARSSSLDEPAVLLARILIVAKEGERLRGIHANVGGHGAGKSDDQFPDSPIEIYRGVPFCVATGAGGTGIPEGAASYVEYLLSHGEWRTTKFALLSNTDITAIANDYLANLERHGFTVSGRFREDVLRQASVPLQPQPPGHARTRP